MHFDTYYSLKFWDFKLGTLNFWYFKRASDAEVDQSWYYFRMADYDFNLMPVYHSVKDYIAKHNN